MVMTRKSKLFVVKFGEESTRVEQHFVSTGIASLANFAPLPDRRILFLGKDSKLFLAELRGSELRRVGEPARVSLDDPLDISFLFVVSQGT